MTAALRAVDVSRRLGDAGHESRAPIDDPAIEGGPLTAVDRNRRTSWRPGYHSTQVDETTVRTTHEGPSMDHHLRLYAIALTNYGYAVQRAEHDGQPCLLVSHNDRSSK